MSVTYSYDHGKRTSNIMDAFVRHLNWYHSTHAFYPTTVLIKSNRTIFVYMKCNAIIIQSVSRFFGTDLFTDLAFLQLGHITVMHLPSHMYRLEACI